MDILSLCLKACLIVSCIHRNGILALLTYTSLEGDLNISLGSVDNIDNSSVIVARVLNYRNETIAQKEPTDTALYGGGQLNVSFACGTIYTSGLHLVEVKINGRLYYSTQLEINWPKLSVEAPSELYNYRSAFHVKLGWLRLKCFPKISNASLRADIVYCGFRNSTCSSNLAQKIRRSVVIENIWRSDSVDVRFDCDVLSHPGYYQVFVRSPSENSAVSVISVSDIIQVFMNQDFQLTIPSRSIFPCGKELNVLYDRPQCTGNRDRIRLYGKTYANVSAAIATPYKLYYLSEKIIVPTKKALSFPCHMFDDDLYDAYCFRYTNLAVNNAVIDTSETCIPVHNTSSVREPQWGSWNEFSSCTVSCGAGVRYRYRYCDNPKPEKVGSFCTGNPTQVESCFLTNCTVDSLLYENPGVTVNKQEVAKNCQCGCSVEVKRDNVSFNLVANTELCNTKVMLWEFQVPKLSRIFVKLKFLRLDCHAGNLLEIRDGESFSSPLIAMFGSNNNQTGNLITTSSKIWLKLNISQPLPEAGSLQCINGFMAIFRSLPNQKIVQRHITHHQTAKVPLIILSFLAAVFLGFLLLIAIYCKCGMTRIEKGNDDEDDDESSCSETSETKLVSMTTVVSVSFDTIPGKLIGDSDVVYKNILLCPKSLPTSPFVKRRKQRDGNPNGLRRSLTSSSSRHLRGLDHSNLDLGKLTKDYRSVEDVYCHPAPVHSEDIELSVMTRDSKMNLGLASESKVLNTKLQDNLSPDDNNSARTSNLASLSVVSMADHEDLEFDYYDLDAGNKGDVPDSFLRCVDDDHSYWDGCEDDSTKNNSAPILGTNMIRHAEDC